MSRNALRISTDAAVKTLTPQQKRFNTLIRQIEQARQTLAAWQEGIDAYRQTHAQLLRPLAAELMTARRQWVLALDELLGRRGWTVAQRETMIELLCETAGQLLDACEDGADLELKAVFDRHAEVDFDTERQQLMRDLKHMTEAMTGVDLGDEDGIESQADLFERMRERLHEKATEEAERPAKTQRPKSAAALRREAEAQQATQSVREIFRKLASALHPDRETDPEQREVKTALMQKVNQAYAASDLLGLLELQLQIEQIDVGHIASVSTERLKQYNKVLSEQLAQLKAQTEDIEMGFRMDFGLGPYERVNPRHLGALVEQDRRQMRAELSQWQHDLRTFADLAATKRWLKQQRKRMQEDDMDFFPF